MSDARERAQTYTGLPPALRWDEIPPGEVRSGELIRLDSRSGDFGFGHQVVPVVIYHDEDLDEPRALWLFHQVARQEFIDTFIGPSGAPRIEPGDTFAYRRLMDGESDKFGSYLRVAVFLEREDAEDHEDRPELDAWEPTDDGGPTAAGADMPFDPDTGEVMEDGDEAGS